MRQRPGIVGICTWPQLHAEMPLQIDCAPLDRLTALADAAAPPTQAAS